MARSAGRDQALAMASLNRGKVDKSIKMPKGFGVVDVVFVDFHRCFKDEFLWQLKSQDGAVAIAGEWQRALAKYPDDVVVKSASIARQYFTVPPDLPAFVDIVKAQLAARKSAPTVTRELGKKTFDEIRGMLSQGS